MQKISIILLAGVLSCLYSSNSLSAQPLLLDESFANNGKLQYFNPIGGAGANCMILQNDNSILIGGYAGTGYKTDWLIQRYDLDGNLDSSFATLGMWTLYCNEYESSISDLVITHDNKIIAAANCSDTFSLIRLNENGLIDSSFGIAGRTKIPSESLSSRGPMIQLPDGKLLVAAEHGSQSNHDIAVMRFWPNGMPDSSFYQNGIRIFDQSLNATPEDLEVQSDGKILVGYSTYDTMGVIRLLSDGTTDLSFGIQGKVNQYTHGGGGGHLLIQLDGNIVVGGSYRNNLPPSDPQTDILIFRCTSEGKLDDSFNSSGVAKIDVTHTDGVSDMQIQPDGKIILSAGFYFVAATDYGVIRINSDGSRDMSIGPNGLVRTDFNGMNDVSLTSVLLPDGDIIFAGRSSPGSYYRISAAKFYSDPNVGVAIAPKAIPFEMTVYPNPFNQYLDVTSHVSNPEFLLLYSIYPPRTYRLKTNESSSFNTTAIPNGLYYYQVWNNHKILGKGKLVKQD